MRMPPRTASAVVVLAGLLCLHHGTSARAQGTAKAGEAAARARLEGLAAEVRQKGYSYQVGYNPAMDYSLTELCGLVEPKGWRERARFQARVEAIPLPSSFDWRVVGLPPVRDQGGCGSCWAFATVGVLESQIMIASGEAVDLSEQYLVSCNTDRWDCAGGWWAHDYHEWKVPPGETEAGAVLEVEFPYLEADVPCAPPHAHPYRIKGWAYVGGTEASVAEIKEAIYLHGPVCAGVAVGPSFQAYTGGVFDNSEYPAYDINHGIVLVGWDDSYSWNGRTYGVWILRNSWGPGWGTEGGYMYITYGTSRVGYAANYIVFADLGSPALLAPGGGVSLTAPPTFAWQGTFDGYLFCTLFYYDLVFWAGYYPFYFLTPFDSYAMDSAWWDKIEFSMPCYWTVCGYRDGWVCSDPRFFRKALSSGKGAQR